MNLAELFDILRVKRTELAGDAKTTILTYFQTPKKHPGDKWQDDSATDESEPVNAWQHYGFISRLPKGAEALVLRWGENTFEMASRIIAAAKVFGQLAEGDVAMFAVPGNMIKLGADGSIVFRVPTDSNQDMVLAFSGKKGGSVKLYIPNGPCCEWSAEKGICQNAGTKPVTFATTDNIQHVCKQQLDLCSVHQLTATGVRPLNAATVAAGGNPAVLY